ncbi:MAG: hypothetical protein AAGH79_04705 [Bacteroidota bacterium]
MITSQFKYFPAGFFIICTIVLGFSFRMTSADWQTFSSEEYACSVELPAPWQVDTTTEANGSKRLRLETESEKHSYLLTFTKYPMSTRLFMRERLAESTRNSLVTALGGELQSADDWKIGEYVGKRGLLKDGDREIEYRVVIIGQIQYQFLVFSKEEKLTNRESKQVFNSFLPIS